MSLNTITVTGTYQDMLGRPGYGVVEFIPENSVFEDDTNNIIYTKQQYNAKVDASGKLSAKIPTTDVAGLTPYSFTYTIVERVTGMENRRTTGVEIPSTLGETIAINLLV